MTHPPHHVHFTITGAIAPFEASPWSDVVPAPGGGCETDAWLRDYAAPAGVYTGVRKKEDLAVRSRSARLMKRVKEPSQAHERLPDSIRLLPSSTSLQSAVALETQKSGKRSLIISPWYLSSR
jgi:hypothetical protein